MAKYIVIICLAFLIPALLTDRSETVAIESVPAVSAPATGGCLCGDACPCHAQRGEADAGAKSPVEIEQPKPQEKSASPDGGLLKVGSRRMLNGIEQELTRVERIGNRVRYFYRPVNSSTMTRSSGGTHWTYPGEIRQHLASGHGVDASGMSREEAESLHDSLHNAERQPELRSNCPGGVCPTPQRRTNSGGSVRLFPLLRR